MATNQENSVGTIDINHKYTCFLKVKVKLMIGIEYYLGDPGRQMENLCEFKNRLKSVQI
mgnify:CR=1